jgi:RecB family exonuclease
MKLHLGRSVTTRIYPQIPGGREAGFGERFVSYGQLCGMLALELGIVQPEISQAKRVSAYREKLAAADSATRFYHASFKLDPLGVAKTLMHWRDELCLAGAGDLSVFGKTKSPRLKDLSEVEKTGGAFLSGEAQRIQGIIDRLKPDATSVVEITLLDAEEVLPEMYRRLLDALRSAGTRITSLSFAFKKAAGNLGLLQNALVAEVATHTQLKPQDGTFTIVETESEAVAAEILSRYLKIAPVADRVVIDEHQNMLFDLVGAENGLPVQGLTEASNLRPVLQLLPVFLSLFWKPLNVYRLLDFLLLPVSPIPKRIRYQLADAVSAQPGIGGRDWQQVLVDAEDGEVERVNEYLMLDRSFENEGVKIKYLQEKLGALAKWALGYGQASPELAQSKQLVMLSAQISDLVDLLADVKAKTITRIELDQLFALATGQGISSSDMKAEAQKPHYVTDPANLLAETDELIWFDFTGEELWNSPKSHWFEDEKAELKTLGIRLVDANLVASQKAAAAVRAVSLARKKLTIFRPLKKLGAETSPHPLFELAKGRVKNLASVTMSQQQLFDAGNNFVGGVEAQPVTERMLPQPQRFWNLGKNAALVRDRTESFSSLSHLLYYPYIYVLQKNARLSSSSIATVAGGAQLLGTIAHDLLERFLKNEIKVKTLDYDSVRAVIAAEVEALIEKEAAVFLMPGEAAQREDLVHWVTRSAIELKTVLNANGYDRFETEKGFKKPFVAGDLAGFVDLIAHGKNKQPVIIDLKWGGKTSKREKIQKGDALQLLIYSYFLKEAAWPDYAYFIIKGAQMLPAKDTFNDMPGLLPAGAESEDVIWQKLEATFTMRKQQLAQGLVEVPLGEWNADEAPAEDASLLPMPEDAEEYNEYGVLTGAEVN